MQRTAGGAAAGEGGPRLSLRDVPGQATVVDALKGYNLPDWRDLAGDAQASSAALRILEALQAAGVAVRGIQTAIGDYKRAKADANEAARYCTMMDGIPITPQKRAK